MSNLPVTVTFAVIFFFLSFLSHSNARTTLTVQPSNLLTEYKPSTTEEYKPSTNEDDSISLIRLPTDNKAQSDVSDSETDMINNIRMTRPLTVMYDFTLPPVNRHFHHLHIRPCHYHGRHVAFDPREVVVGRESGSDGAVKEERVGLDPHEAIASQKSIASDPREMTAPVKEVEEALNPPEVKESTSDRVVHHPTKEEEKSMLDQQEVTVSKESGSDPAVHVPLKEMRVVLTPREVAMRKRIRSGRVVRSPMRKEEKVTFDPREVTMSKESGSDRDSLKEKKFTLDSRDLTVNKKRGFGRMVPAPMNGGRDNKEVLTKNKLKGGRVNRESMLRGGEIEREKLKEEKRGEGLLKKVRKFLNQF